jgi:glucose-6-phosphate 1-dehydrogenase
MKTKLLIFGVTGDLSVRKLLPALDAIVKTGNYDDIEVIGVSRREVNMSELLQSAVGNSQVLKDRTSVITMNMADPEEYDRLKSYLDLDIEDQLLVYLSVPPAAAAQIVDFLGDAGLNTPNVKILFEKPFGVDYKSATEVIARTSRYYGEEQLYRIDHYLAKEMAQNIITFRGGNALFSNMWNKDFIERIEIDALEVIDIEGRGNFYEQTGALRDVMQGHLMQLLALVLMDIPDDFDWSRVPELRAQALSGIRPASPAKTVRAQYEGYQTEVENPGSLTETFVSTELSSRFPQWKGVPIVLTTGKALDRKTTEIRVFLKRRHEAQSNCIVFRIQPNEGVEIDLFTKKPGFEREFDVQKLSFAYPENTVLPDAYEHVIVEAIRSHRSLFTSSEEMLLSWEILQPLLDDWAMSNEIPKIYPKGSATHNICSV